MKYLLKRNNTYLYFRRVPEDIKAFDSRRFVKISLKTDSRELAISKANTLNKKVEAYWKELIQSGESIDLTRFKQATKIVRELGLSYLTASEIAKLPLKQIEDRILATEKATLKQTEAILGAVPPPVITVSKALTLFWDFAKDRMLNKTSDQIRKWKSPRKRAIANFIAIVSDKPITELTRVDTLRVRDWWIERIKEGDVLAQTANKDFKFVRNILDTVSDNLKLELPIDTLFRKISITAHYEKTRLPFSTGHLQNVLLSEKVLSKLTDEESSIIKVLSETGMRNVEVVSLRSDNIVLDDPIPHISLFPSKDRKLKTNHSRRTIPLVGHALDVFRNYPDGFSDYFDKPDYFSQIVNKKLREAGAFPTEDHTVYSLRHSFQDRLTNLDVPDRTQSQLMGHAYKNDQEYGQGADMIKKLEWMQKTQLKVE